MSATRPLPDCMPDEREPEGLAGNGLVQNDLVGNGLATDGLNSDGLSKAHRMAKAPLSAAPGIDALLSAQEPVADLSRGATTGFARLDGAGFPPFAPGSIWLVGAGPGAPGLLTLMGYHALQTADVVVYDALVSEKLLEWVPASARLDYAGKRGGKPSALQRDITLRLIELARDGLRVLRLKGGDPFVFGRGGEEVQALADAGVPYRIVPGVSAGIGGLAYAGIPVTHRDTNHAVTFLTGHDANGTVPSAVNWPAIAQGAPVIVMYMAVKNLSVIAARLMEGGRAADTPVAVVGRATLPTQEVVEATLGCVGARADAGALPTPAIVVVGPVANLRGRIDWFVDRLRDNGLG